MSDSDGGDYSTIFTALKHPVRRKILRMLFEKERSFSEMLEAFKIESSHLTYHLDALGVLVSKTNDGRYRLSTIGEAATSMMYQVEGSPKTPAYISLSNIKGKALFALVMIGVILSAGVIGYVLGYAISARTTLRELLNSPFTTHSEITWEQLKFTVDLEKAGFTVGELVNVIIRLTNIGSKNVTVDVSPPVFNFDVLNAKNQTIYRWVNRRGFSAVILSKTLKPGEYVEQTISWEQTFHDYAGEQVSPGIYYIVGMYSFVLTAQPIKILILT